MVAGTAWGHCRAPLGVPGPPLQHAVHGASDQAHGREDVEEIREGRPIQGLYAEDFRLAAHAPKAWVNIDVL